MSSKGEAQVLALAGLVQSAYLVDQIACTGKYPAESFNPLLHSLFQFDADEAEAIYGSVHGVDLGLKLLVEMFDGPGPDNHKATVRYALGMLYLQKRLMANTDMLSILSNRLKHTQFKNDHFSNEINEIAASVAGIYQDTISTFKYRIQVNGSMQQLQDQSNAHKIRALLLAGIRSAVLWRQSGGRRWHLFFYRKQIARQAKALLER